MQRIVIVTGATSGYGLATAKLFQENGDRVIAVSRNARKVADIVAENGFVDSYALDVTVYAQWVKFRDYVQQKYGRVDILVNNAGGGVAITPVTEQVAGDIDYAIALNLNSVIYGSKLFGAMMKDQGNGMIINLSSVCARHCWAGWSVYAAAKAGVLNFSKGLYVELRPYGVRVTCVIPAAASTGFQRSAGIGEENQTLTPRDVADAVFYAANQPKGVVLEEVTVWGTSQDVQPL